MEAARKEFAEMQMHFGNKTQAMKAVTAIHHVDKGIQNLAEHVENVSHTLKLSKDKSQKRNITGERASSLIECLMLESSYYSQI